MPLLPEPAIVETYHSSFHADDLKVTVVTDSKNILLPCERSKHDNLVNSEAVKREGYLLRASHRGVLLYAHSPAGLHYGKNTANQIIAAENKEDALIIDYPEFETRAFLEKPYGTPWTWEERKDVVETCSRNGFNSYIFGPCYYSLKARWRDPLPRDYKENLGELVEHCHDNHTRLLYELLPLSMDLNAADAEHVILLERIAEVADLGVDGILLAFDDADYLSIISPWNRKRVGEAHVRMANEIFPFVRDRGMVFGFTPVSYFGVKDSPYLQAVREHLHPDIIVGWTGPKIRSDTVTAEDAGKHAEHTGRNPFLGHNFPVIDEQAKKRLLSIAPLLGLDPNLSEHLSGVGFNFMETPYASLIAGLTCGYYAWRPQSYDPEQATRHSCDLIFPELMELVELNGENYTNPHWKHPLATRKRLKHMSADERELMTDHFEQLTTLDQRISGAVGSDSVKQKIYSEIRPWLMQAEITGTMGSMIMDGEIGRYDLVGKCFGAAKIVVGSRLTGLEIENWAFKELGFPSSAFRSLPGRIIGEIFGYVLRGRHRKRI